MKQRRLRSEIVDLFTGLRYLNESAAAEATGLSRYFVHKSIVKHKLYDGHAFSLYSYGMDISLLREIYTKDSRKNKKAMEE